MKVTHQWLQTFFTKPLSRDGLAEALTKLGLEVEEEIALSANFSKVVVGEVLSVAPHPNADKLSVCEVNVGAGDEPLQIVCGAKNVRAAMKTAVALVGAKLPGNFKIKKSKIRGELSFGMLCAANELGLAESSEGIMALPEDAPIGERMASYMHCDDIVWDLAITPNRGDCLSIYGVARELALQHAKGLKDTDVPEVVAEHHTKLSVRMKHEQGCLVYAGMIVTELSAGVVSPMWLQERLRRCGMRSIHPVVDVTNYIQLAYGQPMHAFDADRISGDIHVRPAVQGETLVLLDGRELSLCADDMVVADDEKLLALAGVMGAASSEVGAYTRDIMLESAYFDPDVVRAMVQRYHIHTESSHRFERGIDPTRQQEMLYRAAHLIHGICGGKMGPAATQDHYTGVVIRKPISLRLSKVESVIGAALTPEQIHTYLSSLGMSLLNGQEGYEVVVPPLRSDITQEIDLIEEICRLHGHDQLPAMPLTVQDARFSEHGAMPVAQRVAHGMVDLGYQEVINYAVTSADSQQIFKLDQTLVALKNPLSDEFSTMRVSLLPGLLKNMQYKVNRQKERVRLFEFGTCFCTDGGESEYLAAVAMGDVRPMQWGESPRKTDFFDVKQDVMMILAHLGIPSWSLVWKNQVKHPALHPYQSSALYLGDDLLGWIGALAPSLQRDFKINHKIIAFELKFKYNESKGSQKKLVSDRPWMQRDIALWVPNHRSYREVDEKIREMGKELLKKCELFDIYVDEAVMPGQKSMAFRLTFQDAFRTLRDDEVNALMADIVNVLIQDLDIVLREG